MNDIALLVITALLFINFMGLLIIIKLMLALVRKKNEMIHQFNELKENVHLFNRLTCEETALFRELCEVILYERK